MAKWTRFVAGWTLAAVTAVALSWFAVAQVRNRVIQPSSPIPATTESPQNAAAPAATTTTAVRLEPEPSTTTSLPSFTGTTEPPAVLGTTGVTTPPPPGSPATGASAPTTTTTTTTTTIPVPTTTQPRPSTTTTVAPAVPQTNSYQLVGGSVTISYSPGVVTLVSAIPQPGYSTEIEDSGPDRVRVHFESDDHESEFRAEWAGAELDISKNENGKD